MKAQKLRSYVSGLIGVLVTALLFIVPFMFIFVPGHEDASGSGCPAVLSTERNPVLGEHGRGGSVPRLHAAPSFLELNRNYRCRCCTHGCVWCIDCLHNPAQARKALRYFKHLRACWVNHSSSCCSNYLLDAGPWDVQDHSRRCVNSSGIRTELHHHLVPRLHFNHPERAR